MKSIRLSLVLYFLVLLAAALGAVSVLAYNNSQRLLHAEEETRSELLRTQYKSLCDREHDTLNSTLLRHAQTLADKVQLQYQWNWKRWKQLELVPLGALSSA